MPSLAALRKRSQPVAVRVRPPRRCHGKPRSHFILPDCQIKPGIPLDHMTWIGKYIVDRLPDVIVCLGDFFDLPSMSTHEEPGSLSREGRRLVDDLSHGKEAMRLLLAPLREYQRTHRGYKPRMVFVVGNHSGRFFRYIETHPELEGILGDDPFGLEAAGWEVIPFLQPIEIDGFWYAHYFCRGPSGAVTQTRNGAPTAKAQVQREMRSCIAGHKQGLDVHIQNVGDRCFRGIIAGSCTIHYEDYLSPQGQQFWNGVLILHEVRDGQGDLMEVSLEYLCRRFGRGRWPDGSRI